MRLIATDWRRAGLSPPDYVLCDLAERLTRHPAAASKADIARMKEVGFDETAYHDAVQIISYFNYINRVAEACGVEQETFTFPWEVPAEAGELHEVQL